MPYAEHWYLRLLSQKLGYFTLLPCFLSETGNDQDNIQYSPLFGVYHPRD